MKRAYLQTDDDIAARASAPGDAAIAVVRTAGPGSIERLARVFSRPGILLAAPSHQAVYGRIVGPGKRPVDEVLALVFRAPAGYTGQDGVDVLCHGGQTVVDAVMETLTAVGFQRALPGEFTFRAFINGKLDLARAEAVDELVKARTAGARGNALARLGGELSRRLELLHRELVRLAAACALRLDYGEDESPEDFLDERAALAAVRDGCANLAATYRVGRLLRDGARVVIAGRTNAGKSSLFNCLLKQERAIVSSQPGTTRDYVEAVLDLDGFPVTLIDTAGLRDSADLVEGEGMRRSRLLCEAADLVLYVVDAVAGLEVGDQAFLSEVQRPLLAVWNKLDNSAAGAAPADGRRWLGLSALDGQGESALVAALRTALVGMPAAGEALPDPDGLAITSDRQRQALLRAVAALDDALGLLGSGAIDQPEGVAETAFVHAGFGLDMVAVDIQAALAALGELSGETTSADILDALFSSFCVGK
ncbi:MAG: tRNA uridine-5-carboxymethylaminomethyl(34) synthesis GTPase MnmE [Spirochaetes bacterium GWD1_61_31]|nr:MAG: tRNA uridine-5-carboxymethylaminomethyl(34) synthesis GTPase MnmE [Spirochaetes bacterium GWB1_60_80]OHD35783.1 MAG: tRNA uridine-5-carboxymethylaminomethyl(34) synthesis GTPase MnmE [Spirochaetes bacterium GWD1_61_31]OHD42920.1 MAG: tRNA uridine-5-carboxymethylaminomethyl(34) synthesis GTPase MnmE [Spirochaetes bacterium GWE1_60_18]OHD61280.1 MAG: tRNA uridine-5-carboxymethylaminomethyl(34) synthesis GTPase MnmE [Spirochaetes bacterium GWF1_60_12]